MLNTNYKIAGVYLTAKPRQTIVALLGVTFGISMYVFMISFVTGVNEMTNKLAFTSFAHIRIYNDGPKDNTDLISEKSNETALVNLRNAKVIKYTTGIKNPAELIKLLQHQPEVTGVTPQVNVSVFFRNGGNKINGMLSGVEVDAENRLFTIADYMVSGNWNSLKTQPNGIILGVKLAKSLRVGIDDNVNVLTAEGIMKNLKVIGVFKTNMGSIDGTKAYLNINSTRQMLAKNQSYVTDLQIMVNDYKVTAPLVQRLSTVVPYNTESWQTSNQQMYAQSKLYDMVARAVSFTILLVAGFGIYNIMNMTINEKIKEIAILKAMGYSGFDITVIFLTQALVIGVLGGIIGMLIGFCLGYIVELIPFKMGALDHLPMAYHVKDYLMAFLFGLATTFIAGYMPARKAAKIDPVEIIRS